MIGHAVFDLDGTLVDSAPQIASILNAMLADRGVAARVTDADARPRVTAGGRAMIEALLGDACGDVDTSLSEFRARYASAPTPRESLYTGVDEALGALKDAGAGLAVWSNKPQALCEKVLAELGISHLFDAVVGTGASTPHKPDPAGFDRALDLAGGRRAASCLIGDTNLDHAAAVRANVPFVWVAHGYGDTAPEGARVAGDIIRACAVAREVLERR